MAADSLMLSELEKQRGENVVLAGRKSGFGVHVR
jgi:hypothetical protein